MSEGVRGPINSAVNQGHNGEYGYEVGFERENVLFSCVALMSVALMSVEGHQLVINFPFLLYDPLVICASLIV